MRSTPTSFGNVYKLARRFIILSLVVGMALGFYNATSQLFTGKGERVIAGVSLPGQPLGGLRDEAARWMVQRWVQQRTTHIMRVHGPKQSWTISAEVMPKLDVEQIVQEALSIGRRGALQQRWSERWQARTKGVVLLKDQMPDAKLHRWLEGIVPSLYQPAHNAYRDLVTGQVIPEKLGQRLDVTASANQLHAGFLALVSDAQLVLQPIKPQIVAEMVEKTEASVRISRFSTVFNPQLANRVANIRLAAAALDGTIIPPGAIFSFNQTVGARERANGYLEAPELVGGDLVSGVGGGVCQVSSTLYNAVLLADLKVVERYKHSTPSTYIDIGRDATVSYEHMDFRFRNSLKYPLVIRTFVSENQLTVSLYGKQSLPYEVVLFSDISEIPMPIHMETDPELLPDEQVVVQEGQSGKTVIIKKELRYADGRVQRYEVSHNLYEAKPQLIKVGIDPPQAEIEPR
jgi:vancomycin resistance protein YoaR